jgi:N-methylhydantoinase B
VPTRVIAGHHADLVIAMVNGRQPRDGSLFIYLGGLIGGGWGAKLGEDGMSATIAINDGDTHNSPSEQAEVKYPVLIERYALREDSGGAGKHRGGLGTEQVVHALGEIMFNAQIERVDCRPWGLFGGLSGLGNEVELNRDGEQMRFPTGKVLAQMLKKGDVYTLRSGGGGGCGNPLDRKLDDVEEDVRQGYVSAEAAHQLYGVEIEAATGRADPARSAALRRDMRARGLPKDQPFAREDFSRFGCPHCAWPMRDPAAESMTQAVAAAGLNRWRCCGGS